MKCVTVLSQDVGLARACDVLGVSRASFYRWCRPPGEHKPRPTPPRALNTSERQEVLVTLNSKEFSDKAPAEVYATLLDRQVYLCSIRTMYRILEDNGEVRERRDQLRHPAYKKPELLATGPNQVWSWDITKLLGPVKWTYYYLYVILDIYSRYVVGWLVAQRESAQLAMKLITQTVEKQGIEPGQLVVHADRGSSMASKPVALLLSDLGITKSHSRPHVSDDNPFSEAQFKTLKYRPEFPDRFGSLEDARSFCRVFFEWYNHEHHHWSIGLLTPSAVHHGQAAELLEARAGVLARAYSAHPQRFVNGHPQPLELPTAVWINPPTPTKGPQDGQGGSAPQSDPPGSSINDDRGSARPVGPPEKGPLNDAPGVRVIVDSGFKEPSDDTRLTTFITSNNPSQPNTPSGGQSFYSKFTSQVSQSR